MAVASLEKVVNGSFVRRFQGLATGAASSTSPLGGSSTVTVADGLRLGARTFATAVQGLNATISFVNISRNTLSQLGKVVGDMVNLAEEASQNGVGSDGRAEINFKFKKLVQKFRQVVSNSEIGGDDYLTSDGIGAILQKMGLTEEVSNRLKKIFDAFALPKTEGKFASEAYKASRPLEIPDSVFAAPVSKTIYRLQNVSNNSGDIDSSSASIAPNGGVFRATDTLLNQNPGAGAVFAVDQNGTITSQGAGTLVAPHDITEIMAVNELNLNASSKPGYSLVKSTGNLFGNFNPSNFEQVFMLDETGSVVAQVTNNDGTLSYTAADLSADGLSYVIATKYFDGVDYTYQAGKLTASSIGEDPSIMWAAAEAGVSRTTALNDPGISRVEISPDGTHLLISNLPATYSSYFLFQNASGGGGGVDFASSFYTSAASHVAFVGATSQIAIAEASTVKTYSFFAAGTTTVLSGVSIDSFAALGTATQAGIGGYFSYYDSTDQSIHLYSVNSGLTAATAVDMNSSNSSTSYSLGASASVGTLSMALRSDGYVDLGIAGKITDVGGGESELYRLAFNAQSLPGRRTGLSSTEPGKILDWDLSTRPDAFRALQDLKKLREQITENIETLDKVTDFIGENLDLVRAAGFAFLDLSNQITTETDADQVALELQAAIRRNARGSLAQAENLTSIVVASLTYGS
jgi:hypothetical protein